MLMNNHYMTVEEKKTVKIKPKPVDYFNTKK